MHAAMQAGDCALEPSVFATTSGFTTTHGFAVPAATADGAERAVTSLPSLGSVGADSSTNCSTSCGGVGWKGLLETSRAAGGSGVLGSASSMDADSAASAHIEVCCTAHITPGIRRLIKSVIRGLKACQEPECASDGMGGCYFFSNDNGCKVAIFKPCDEEALAPSNPKGYVGRQLGEPGWKPTVRVGEAAMREVAAYLLDHDHFARVPHTVLVRAAHSAFHYATALPAGSMKSGSFAAAAAALDGPTPRSSSGGGEASLALKLGSLQEFVHHVADTSEFGTARLSARDVHRIGILDVRLFNTDRHAGNILVRPRGGGGSSSGGGSGRASCSNLRARLSDHSCEYELIPIDHGFCLPEALDAPFFEWLHWSQAMLPFSDEELDYIARLDVEADIKLLQSELPNLRPECLRVLEVSTTLLQRCAAAGLTLCEIGSVMTRQLDVLDGDDAPLSEFEHICVAARQVVETRELVALASGSSGSSGGHFALREEDEEEQEQEEHDCCDTPQHMACCAAPQPRAGAAACDKQGGHGCGAVLLHGGVSPVGPLRAFNARFTCSDTASSGSDMSVAITALSSSLSACMTQVREGEQLLFELDEEGASPPAVAMRMHSSEAPMALSPGSHASECVAMSPVERLQNPNSFSAGSSSLAIPAPPPKLPHALSVLPMAPMNVARSVTTDAFIWRTGLKGPSVAAVRRAKHGLGTHGARTPYPPPVIAAAPRSANEVLSGLNEVQWRVFMDELCVLIDEALADGRWKAAAPHGVAAMSCPRF